MTDLNCISESLQTDTCLILLNNKHLVYTILTKNSTYLTLIMYYLIYISTAVKLMSQDDLADILTKSRANNIAKKVTGILLYSQGTFIQALEGDEEAVMETYHKIEKDGNHKNLVIIITGTSKQRVFADWSMAFISVDPNKMDELEGYINPLKQELFEGNETNPAITIMKTFADNNNLTYNQ